eukprot:scaffold263413_cov28-Tisochrysis_lutea.AAC.1
MWDQSRVGRISLFSKRGYRHELDERHGGFRWKRGATPGLVARRLADRLGQTCCNGRGDHGHCAQVSGHDHKRKACETDDVRCQGHCDASP